MCGDRCLVGAGTVIDVADVARVRAAGGKVVVMPHADTAVVREAKAQGMVCVPGVATPTEAFAALAAGADGLKMFPAEALPPGALKAWRAVLPRESLVFAVGGIRPDNMAPYWARVHPVSGRDPIFTRRAHSPKMCGPPRPPMPRGSGHCPEIDGGLATPGKDEFPMRAISMLVVLVMVVPVSPMAWAARGSIRCESRNYNRNFCRVDTENNVTLRRQLSSAPCQRNRTWGFDNRGIWVDRGCSADFDFGRGNNSGNSGSNNNMPRLPQEFWARWRWGR